jgi:hypothetical protein
MKDRVTGPGLEFRCRMVDIRILDGDDLIASEHVEDDVLAVLARFHDEHEAVRRILQRVARSGRERRALAIDELTLLAGLRKLEPLINREAMQMPILNDIMDHQVYGPLLREGREKGRDEGRELFSDDGRRALRSRSREIQETDCKHSAGAVEAHGAARYAGQKSRRPSEVILRSLYKRQISSSRS